MSSNYPKKPNEKIRRSSKNEFLGSFFGRIRGYQKSFRNYLTFTINLQAILIIKVINSVLEFLILAHGRRA